MELSLVASMFSARRKSVDNKLGIWDISVVVGNIPLDCSKKFFSSGENFLRSFLSTYIIDIYQMSLDADEFFSGNWESLKRKTIDRSMACL